MADLIFHSTPRISFASNTFINVATILQFDDTPLISVVREADLGFTSEIPIYHSDGTYLAKVRGTRVYPTDDGTNAGVEVRQLPGIWVCSVGGRTAFEIRQESGDAFRTQAELYAPNGFFVKVADAPPQLYDAGGEALSIRGITMIGNVFENLRIGVWVRSDRSVAIGVS
jgi:hypothetical protein